MSTAKQNVVEFILNNHERLRHALDLASTHAAQERSKAIVWYDRHAHLRTFEPGDKVLELTPMPGKPLHAKYHSPHTVEQQLGPVDYVISTLDCRKTKRVCHVNRLKPYHERDPELDPVVTSIPADIFVQSPVMEVMECPVPTSLPTSVPVVETLLSTADGQLTSTQTVELTALLDEFGDVFSDVSGRTTLGVHHTELKPDTKPIRCPPYRLNQEKAKVLKYELVNLLDQGIIEESTSPWASPIVRCPLRQMGPWDPASVQRLLESK